jgi:hypothetical protein
MLYSVLTLFWNGLYITEPKADWVTLVFSNSEITGCLKALFKFLSKASFAFYLSIKMFLLMSGFLWSSSIISYRLLFSSYHQSDSHHQRYLSVHSVPSVLLHIYLNLQKIELSLLIRNSKMLNYLDSSFLHFRHRKLWYLH